jgi:hypothetical protein
MPRPHISPAAIALCAAIPLAGCASLQDPDAHLGHTTTRSTPTITVSDPTPAPERNGTIPPAASLVQRQLAPDAAAASPVLALERYAERWSNWTAATVIADQRALAALSLGQARAQALQAIASLRQDRTLTASHVANRGQVIAISPQLTTPDQWVIVTSETTTGQGDYAGLPPTLHVTYARVTRTRQGYVVSVWSPQR